ncbi:hypothetical protein ZWY2020_012948 [Hordeum vulgare]|nr:hypothetical protein ZWY2020_012948 [Hordeum vulgare]
MKMARPKVPPFLQSVSISCCSADVVRYVGAIFEAADAREQFLREIRHRRQTLPRFVDRKNLLTDDVPEGLWALPKAKIIDLKGNQFTGSIGDGIGKVESLTSLFLAGNKFSGVIPSSIGDAANLQSIDVSSNELCGEIPRSWRPCRRRLLVGQMGQRGQHLRTSVAVWCRGRGLRSGQLTTVLNNARKMYIMSGF